jgi:UDP:flavonoid glycosyltransferase YjiC (YdhE family)
LTVRIVTERVVAARAGIVVEPASVTVRSIASAVERALVDPALRSGPQAVAREIAAMPSAEDVIARLENRLLEAA